MWVSGLMDSKKFRVQVVSIERIKLKTGPYRTDSEKESAIVATKA